MMEDFSTGLVSKATLSTLNTHNPKKHLSGRHASRGNDICMEAQSSAPRNKK